MSKEFFAESQAKNLYDAYELLISSLRWERDRWLKVAEQVAREHGAQEANRMLEQQAEYIRKQAIR